jgi:MFS family permease
MLAASQFTDMFHLTPPGGEALSAIEASDQHGYASLVLAIFALAMIAVSLATAGAGDGDGASLSQIAAVAVAVCGAVALLIFLVGDLPDVNKIGTLDDPNQSFIDSKARPQAGFWLELVGALVLTVCGAGLATMAPQRAPGEREEAEARRADRAEGTRRRSADSDFEWPSRSRSRERS